MSTRLANSHTPIRNLGGKEFTTPDDPDAEFAVYGLRGQGVTLGSVRRAVTTMILEAGNVNPHSELARQAEKEIFLALNNLREKY
ncbi:hypothetical protein IPM62_00705 [Candidatus Woesebacteria bacterium]|nr:MAG: hypothetical protein IPM62_00705 [Candidatus Woesebacteria bacterium]